MKVTRCLKSLSLPVRSPGKPGSLHRLLDELPVLLGPASWVQRPRFGETDLFHDIKHFGVPSSHQSIILIASPFPRSAPLSCYRSCLVLKDCPEVPG